MKKQLQIYRKRRLILLMSLLQTLWVTAQVAFSTPEVVANASELIEIPIRVDKFTNAVGFELKMQLPEEKFEFVALTKVHAALKNFSNLNYRYSGGVLSVVWADTSFKPHTLSEQSVLFYVKLKVVTKLRERWQFTFLTSKVANAQGAPMTTETAGGMMTFGACQLALSSQVVGVGSSFKIPVRAKNFAGVAGFQAVFKYPKNALKFVSVTNFHRDLTGMSTANFFELTQGEVRVVWDQPQVLNTAIDNDEILFELSFQARQSEGEFPLEVVDLKVFNNQAQEELSANAKAMIKILAYLKISGTIVNEDNKPLPKSTVVLTTDTKEKKQLTNNTGTFLFNTLPKSGGTLTVQRALAMTNGINVADILLIRKYLLGKSIALSPYKLIAADTDASNAIDVADIITLRKVILQRQAGFSQSWKFVPKNFVFPNPQNPFASTIPHRIVMTPLDASVKNQDFVGIKVGDVNNDHVVNNRGVDKVVELGFFECESIVDEEFSVCLKVVDNYVDISAFQATFSYDANEFHFLGLESGVLNRSDLDYELLAKDPGKVSLLYTDNQAEGHSHGRGVSLLALKFKRKRPLMKSSSIAMEGSIVPMMAFDEGLNRLKMDVQKLEISPSNSSTLPQIYPNPGSVFTIEVKGSTGEQVRLKLMDPTGKVVLNQTFVLEMTKGVKQLDLRFLPKGMYLLESEQEGRKSIQKIIVN